MIARQLKNALLHGVITTTACLGPTASAITTNLTCVADTSLHEAFPDLNFGGGASFTAGGRIMGGRTRALLKFDVAAAIPAEAVINSASLKLTVTATSGTAPVNSNFDLNRVTGEWIEGAGDDFHGTAAQTGEVTWNNRAAPSTPWTTIGGDYVGAPAATRFIAGNGAYEFDSSGLADDVQFWLTNSAGNFGWLLRSQTETAAGTIRRFAGRNSPTEFPVLTVDYTVSAAPVSPDIFDAAQLGNLFRFSFNGLAGRTYAVEFTNSPSSGNWPILTNIPALLADLPVHVTNAISGDAGYFRVRTP